MKYKTDLSGEGNGLQTGRGGQRIIGSPKAHGSGRLKKRPSAEGAAKDVLVGGGLEKG